MRWNSIERRTSSDESRAMAERVKHKQRRAHHQMTWLGIDGCTHRVAMVKLVFNSKELIR